MLEQQVEHATMELVAVLRASETYQEYQNQLERIKEQPELFEKVNTFRMKNFRLQNAAVEGGIPAGHLSEQMEELDREYEELTMIPLADDFLKAETSFCRMMQDMNMHIIRNLEFQ